jgi:Tfp pilus assembly PilM family ATPase
MVKLFGNHAYPIGVDISSDALTLVQMANSGHVFRMHASASTERPDSIEPGSPSWQKWAIEIMTKSVAHGRFQGKKVVAAMPAGEVFIDTIKMPEVPESELKNAIINNLTPKLGISPEDVLIEHLKIGSENILVMATDKTKLYKHLAIYEKAHLRVASISIWPVAVFKAYVHLWAKRMEQDDKPVMLLDIAKSYTNIVICDSTNLYLAHSTPVGSQNLDIDRMVDLLNSDMDMCRVKFRSSYEKPPINHAIFVSGHTVDKDIYTKIAKRAVVSAQIGDCFEAVGAAHPDQAGPENRVSQPNWITAIGLSLS